MGIWWLLDANGQRRTCADRNCASRSISTLLKLHPQSEGRYSEDEGNKLWWCWANLAWQFYHKLACPTWQFFFLRQMWSIGVWIRAQIAPDPGKQQGHMRRANSQHRAPELGELQTAPPGAHTCPSSSPRGTAVGPECSDPYGTLRVFRSENSASTAKDMMVGYEPFPVGKRS